MYTFIYTTAQIIEIEGRRLEREDIRGYTFIYTTAESRGEEKNEEARNIVAVMRSSGSTAKICRNSTVCVCGVVWCRCGVVWC